MSTDARVAKDLVETLKDGRDGFTAAAERLRGSDQPELAATMQRLAEQRAQFAGEIVAMGHDYGDDVDESGSAAGALHRGWLKVKDAVTGVVRSAFGLSGQKCSACSRVYVEHTVFADFVAALHGATAKVAVGDPTRREHWMGPVIDAAAVARYEDAAAQIRALGAEGAIVEGGLRLDRNDLALGHFVAPTVARAPLDHPLWSRELFAPFVLVAPVENVDEGIARANALAFGLTAGFYGGEEETERFFGSIEAGVTYANRPQGATTGAWPGFQPFGGWKGSGSTGRGGGSLYYLPQYLREQSQTRVRRES